MGGTFGKECANVTLAVVEHGAHASDHRARCQTADDGVFTAIWKSGTGGSKEAPLPGHPGRSNRRQGVKN